MLPASGAEGRCASAGDPGGQVVEAASRGRSGGTQRASRPSGPDSRLDRREVTRLADLFAARYGIRSGPGIVEAYARLGGRYREVPSTFGLDDDRIVCRGPAEVEAVGERGIGHDLVLLGEALAILLVHRRLAVEIHGPDVVRAVPRRTPDGDAALVMREALWFGTALVMPGAGFRAAHAEDPDPQAIARRFGVPRRSAEGRAKSLGLAVPEPAF